MKLLYAFLISAVLLPAQSTWRGLRFGMTETEVRKAYDGVFRDHEPAEGAFDLVDDNQRLARSSTSNRRAKGFGIA